MELVPQEADKIRVCIGLVSHKGEYHPMMQGCLDNLVQYSRKQGISILISRQAGSILPHNRNMCVKDAIDNHATHLLFIDSDMAFDKDALVRLLERRVDIVGGLCVKRGEPYTPVGKRIDRLGIYRNAKDMDRGGLIDDLDSTGTAFLLIRTRVLKMLSQPWFAMPPIGDAVMGEDTYFCKKAKDSGYKICVDGDLVIGHICDFVATIDTWLDYKAERERREAEEKKECKVA